MGSAITTVYRSRTIDEIFGMKTALSSSAVASYNCGANSTKAQRTM